jgi:hypothetical protein
VKLSTGEDARAYTVKINRARIEKWIRLKHKRTGGWDRCEPQVLAAFQPLVRCL